ncbi:MAG: PadR family transcriptional regulator [Desulfurococcales archaeon]|nr:PadR family transcriptional regulator [Desulfurococcales archaeon]
MDVADKLLRDARRGLLAVAVLEVLLDEGPLHGYGLRKSLTIRMGWEPPEASLYDALKRLEKLGLVKGRWVRAGRGPLRRVYVATEEGRRVHGKVVRLLSSIIGWLICREVGEG